MDAIITETEPVKKISRRGMWLRAHKHFIEEVTDPELRSQLAYYRNKDKKEVVEQQEVLEEAV